MRSRPLGTDLSPDEAATVARFDAAEPAPESYGPHHWQYDEDADPSCEDCWATLSEGVHICRAEDLASVARYHENLTAPAVESLRERMARAMYERYHEPFTDGSDLWPRASNQEEWRGLADAAIAAMRGES